MCGGARISESSRMWGNYFTEVVKGRATDFLVGRLQEMRTIAPVLMKGAQGQHKALLDILVQRASDLHVDDDLTPWLYDIPYPRADQAC